MLQCPAPCALPPTRQQVEGRKGKGGGGEHNVQADQAVAPRVQLDVDVLLGRQEKGEG